MWGLYLVLGFDRPRGFTPKHPLDLPESGIKCYSEFLLDILDIQRSRQHALRRTAEFNRDRTDKDPWAATYQVNRWQGFEYYSASLEGDKGDLWPSATWKVDLVRPTKQEVLAALFYREATRSEMLTQLSVCLDKLNYAMTGSASWPTGFTEVTPTADELRGIGLAGPTEVKEVRAVAVKAARKRKQKAK